MFTIISLFFLMSIFLIITIFKLIYNEIDYVIPDIELFDNKNWMSTLKKDTKIMDITLPGTHDSLAFKDLSTERFHDHDKFVKYIDKLNWVPGLKKKISRWVKTQPCDIYQQLKCGIRFFDFRIAETYKQTCCGYHTFITSDMKNSISQINEFLKANPLEIIVIHLRCYREFCKNFFFNNLDKYILNPHLNTMRTITLGEMQSINKNVIVFEFGTNEDIIEGTWVDTFNTEEKIAHLDKEIVKQGEMIKQDKMINLEWTITPGIREIILNRGSILSVSDDFNQLLTPFIIKHSNDSNKTNVNIVSIDNFRSVNLVKILNEYNAQYQKDKIQ